jgi:hypothetical protein
LFGFRGAPAPGVGEPTSSPFCDSPLVKHANDARASRSDRRSVLATFRARTRQSSGKPDGWVAALQAAIDRLTRAIATANDQTIPRLVTERRAMRDELEGLKREAAEKYAVLSAYRRAHPETHRILDIRVIASRPLGSNRCSPLDP